MIQYTLKRGSKYLSQILNTDYIFRGYMPSASIRYEREKDLTELSKSLDCKIVMVTILKNGVWIEFN